MENTEQTDGQELFYVNAVIQLSAIFAFQQFAVIWPLYIIVALISILIVIQTLGAAALFAQITPTKVSTRKTKGINIMISLLYMISCYHIYLIGFTGFALVGAAHCAIHFLANVLGAIK